MASKILSASLLLASLASARQCTNVSIPVEISSRLGVFSEIPIESNLDTIAFSQALTRQGNNYTAELLQDYATVSGNYCISASYCYPDSGPGSSIQILSHGIGFDKTYWDLSYNNYNYSYVEVAVQEGYSTLAIDRLGIGNSSHGDPLNEIQAQAEVEALNAITTKLRNGGVPGINATYSRVIHVGHSFGSVQSYWLSALYPNNTDGLVLTGWSANATYIPLTAAAWNLHSARLNQPLRFGNYSNTGVLDKTQSLSSWENLESAISALLSTVDITASSTDLWELFGTTQLRNLITGYNQSITPLEYSSGYMTWPDLASNQYAFLLNGFYDIGLGIVAEASKQPVTTGELLTIGSSPSFTSFTGPVFVITGSHDVPFCGGDCYATGGVADNIPVQAEKLFPSASVFEAYIQPDTAHGINTHHNATASYQVVQDWLAAHGVGA